MMFSGQVFGIAALLPYLAFSLPSSPRFPELQPRSACSNEPNTHLVSVRSFGQHGCVGVNLDYTFTDYLPPGHVNLPCHNSAPAAYSFAANAPPSRDCWLRHYAIPNCNEADKTMFTDNQLGVPMIPVEAESPSGSKSHRVICYQ